MRAFISLLALLAAQIAAAQTQFIGVPTTPPAANVVTTDQPRPKVILPPVQGESGPRPQSITESSGPEFPQCGKKAPTGNASLASKMFEKILGVPNPFREPLHNRAKDEKFALGNRGGSLVVIVKNEAAAGVVCQNGNTVQVTLTHWSGTYVAIVEPIDSNRVKIAGDVPAGIYSRGVR